MIFTLVIFILFLALTLWIFLSDMEDSVIDSFVSEKISLYNSSQDLFNLVIDTVQRDLQCCGFKSASDWAGEYPHSCCDKFEEECGEENIYNTTCKEGVRCSLTKLLFLANQNQPSSYLSGRIFCSPQVCWECLE